MPARSYGPGIVNGTLVLANNSYQRGNFQPDDAFSPVSPVYDSATGKVYVLESDTGSLSVVDLSTNRVAADLVGVGGSDMALDTVNGDLYVAYSGGLSVIDPTTLSFLKNISIPSGATSVAYNSVDGDLFVGTDVGSGFVEVVSPTSGTILTTVNVGLSPDSLAADSSNGNVLVANYGSQNLSVLSGSTFGVIATVPVGPSDFPDAVAFDPVTGQYFVGSTASGNITVVDGTSNTITTVMRFANPIFSNVDLSAIAFDSTNQDIYVADQGDMVLNVVNPASDTLVTNVSITGNPSGLTFDPTNGNLYATNLASSIDVINGATNLQITWFPVGSIPGSMSFDSASGNVFVSNESEGFIGGSGSVLGFSSTTNSIFSAPAMGDAPWAPAPTAYTPRQEAYDPANGDIYVALEGTDSAIATSYFSVAVIDGSTGALLSEMALPLVATCLVYDSANQVMYLGANGAGPYAGALLGFDATGARVSDLPLSAGALSLAYDSADGYIDVLASNGGTSDQILVVNPVTNTTVNTFNPDPNFLAMATSLTYDPVNGDLYGGETLALPGGLSVVNATTGRLVANVSQVAGLTMYDPANGDVYVTDDSLDAVDVISTASNTQIATIPVGAGPMGITENASGTMIYVSNFNSGSVSEISLTAPTTPVESVTSVSVSPGTATMGLLGSSTFSATPVCSPSACPTSVAYSWSTVNGLGTLSSSTGNPVTYTAGNAAGSDTLTVSASLPGGSATGSASITISASTVPPLASVSISPSGPNVATGGTVSLTATASCTGGACPAGTTYSWTVSNTVGSLSPSTGATVTFTAGTSTGSDLVTVSASLNGKTVSGSTTVTVSTNGGGPGGSGSGNGNGGFPLLYLVLALVAAAAVVGVVLFLKFRGRIPKGSTSAPSSAAAPAPAAPPPAAPEAPSPPPPSSWEAPPPASPSLPPPPPPSPPMG